MAVVHITLLYVSSELIASFIIEVESQNKVDGYVDIKAYSKLTKTKHLTTQVDHFVLPSLAYYSSSTIRVCVTSVSAEI